MAISEVRYPPSGSMGPSEECRFILHVELGPVRVGESRRNLTEVWQEETLVALAAREARSRALWEHNGDERIANSHSKAGGAEGAIAEPKLRAGLID